MEFMALPLESNEVPGATPKKPASGLIAYSLPSSPKFIQAISSPTVSTFHPGMVGTSMARFVLPQALGKAAATCFFSPSGLVNFKDQHMFGHPAFVTRLCRSNAQG